jgi:hypothetical protein
MKKSSRNFPPCPLPSRPSAVRNIPEGVLKSYYGRTRISVSGAGIAVSRHGPGTGRFVSRGPRRFRRSRQRSRLFHLRNVFLRLRRSAQAHRKHPARHLDGFRGHRVLLEEKGIRPDFVAGHSLGEYSALVAPGAFISDAVRLVRRRGNTCRRLCLPAKAPWPPSWDCAPARWRRSAASAADGQVVAAANLNSPEQTVISGNAAAVKRAVEQASGQRAPSAP